jgi:predicted histone-like DNA-binding protein
MSIFYKKMERNKPRDVKAPKRWYPVIKSTGMVKEKEIAALLADETTLNPKEAEMAVYQLFKVVSTLLLDGKTVQLSDLGSFRVTANTEASDKETEVTASKIKKINVRFTASEGLRNAMKKAKFIDAATLVKK